ncbi:MAG: TlpA disulfide reductase family protein [Caldilineaceae bacterium]
MNNENLVSPAPPSALPASDRNIEAPSAQLLEQTAAPANTWPAWVRLLIMMVLITFVAILAIALMRQNTSEQRAAGLAPDFEFTTFDGETIRLADLKGKGVVLNFWASWCDPCRAEAALLQEVAQREEDNGIVFLGLDYLDQEHAALAYLAEYGITYPNGPDLQSTIARRYRINGVPETFFITPDGEIDFTVIGPIQSESALNARLDAIRP